MINKVSYIHIKECYMVMKMNKLHLSVTIGNLYYIECHKLDMLSAYTYIFRKGRIPWK